MGKIQLPAIMGNLVWSYDMDRTICDIIRSKSRIADETFIASLKQYAASSNKNLGKLNQYASKMGIVAKVRKYMEVLL